ncbi:MAG: CPBP family intramembrane glutamic endopeptidase [Anaerolineales bacterium]|nr:CPBP family intramembrane metalloprotease [Anaerolineales bacterium]MCS7249205.1 CPBP family intramembrane metalloprotease [Anaerolineales bacterium]MDW8163018.1 CPBP family intramembrane glutamic endopeptidase [Anaerolineales bacterium]MDW8446178.1 CPBP family intramembrane glutamic endopeptidase [Anaerolineales bacterium]
MENQFLAQAQSGKNAWWRYLVGILIILIVWQVGGALLILPLIAANQGKVPEEATPVSFVFFLSTFAFLLLGTWLVNRLWHGRSVLSLTTPFGRVNWKRVFLGIAVWLVAMTIVAVVEALLHPGRYVLNPNPVSIIPYFLLGLVLIPMQTSAEEYFFRGYLLQASGRLMRNPFALSVLNGVLFAFPHLMNPEVGVMGLALSVAFYAAMGFFLAWLTLRSQTLELALGIHAANNFFTGIFANYVTTALPTESLFIIQTLDPVFGLVSFLVAAGAVYLVLSLTGMRQLAFAR